MGLSVRQLKEELTARGVDFSACREKYELEELFEEHRHQIVQTAQTDQTSLGEKNPSTPSTDVTCDGGETKSLLEDGGFALNQSLGRHCWVEFVDGNDALCVWADGSTSMACADALVPVTSMPGPVAFDGSFEEARAEAFHSGRILMTIVHGESLKSTKDRLLVLTLSSDDVSSLLDGNVILWKGPASELRAPHVQQLAPEGTPSVCMVLPVAVDAMRVLSHSDGQSVERVVQDYIDALEKHETHKAEKEARLLNEEALLRMEQDEEYAASLEMDRLAHETIRREQEAAAVHMRTADAEEREMDERTQAEQSSKRARSPHEHCHEDMRLLLDEFEAEGTPPEGCDVTRLMLRLPSGQRIQRTFCSSDPFSKVRRWVRCCPWLPENAGQELSIPDRFDSTLSFPRRQLDPDKDNATLAELGLAPSAALLLIDRSV
eukprot:TRINITY_DN1954_c1_g1_i2.p1 TRINITY_DN1954_c1_g1~~TRINITY_DN1954_c1_g1_i2.p1  ORF type:complete len:444 (-),score=56.53 TRINITY_DN1954_c1_g1_i2:219-1520(-)